MCDIWTENSIGAITLTDSRLIGLRKFPRSKSIPSHRPQRLKKCHASRSIQKCANSLYYVIYVIFYVSKEHKCIFQYLMPHNVPEWGQMKVSDMAETFANESLQHNFLGISKELFLQIL